MLSSVSLVFRVVLAAIVFLPSLRAMAAAPKVPTIKTSGLTQADFSTSLANGARGIFVQWTDNSNDEDFFVIYSRKGTSGAFGRTSRAGQNATNVAIVPLSNSFPAGTVFQFVVTACKGVFSADRLLVYEDGTTTDPNNSKWAKISEQSVISSPITVVWPGAAAGFAAPSGFDVTSTGDGPLHFSFTDNADSEDSHELNIRLASDSADESKWRELNAFFGSTTAYFWPYNLRSHDLFLPLTPGVAYQFRIRALRRSDLSGTSAATAWSNTKEFTIPQLDAPTNLVGSSPQENVVALTWTDNSSAEQGYLMERKLPSDSTWTIWSTVPANYTAATLRPVGPPGVAYEWRVSAAFDTGTQDSSTVNLTSCVLNTSGSTSGSTLVTCASTTGLISGASLTGPNVAVAGNTTSGSPSVTNTTTGSLLVGMFLSGTGIPSGARILSIDSASAFTMSANATSAGTATPITATYLAANMAVSSVTSETTFLLNALAFANTTSAPIAVSGTTFTPVFARGSSNVVTVTTAFNAPSGLQATVDNDSTLPFSKVKVTWIDNSNGETGYQLRARLSSAAEEDASYTQLALINAATAAAPQSMSATLFSELPAGQSLIIQVRTFADGSSTRVYSNPANQAVVTTKHGFTGELYFPATKGTAITDYTVQTTSNATIADNAGTPDISVSDLPDGLTFTPTTRIISGTPAEAGLFKCPMRVTFTDGTTATDTLELRVLLAPGPPTKPVTLTTRTLALNKPVSIPLTDLFADPDTEKAVKFKIQSGATTNPVKEVDVILYESLTPETVANFMNYVLSNDYENVVFNRLVTGFVLQGGSYKFIPSLSTTTPLFTNVLSRQSPVNEPGISNVLGTLAMAKVAGNPNSATHDFFFSLNDNSGNLDHQNGGFTAFGRVAGTGMTSINQIGALRTTPAAPETGAPDKRYRINVRDPRGGSTTEQTVETFPIDSPSATLPTQIQATEMVVIKSIAPIKDLLTYSTPTNSSPTHVRVNVVDGALVLEGLAEGVSNVSLTATDLDGNIATQSFTVSVDSGYVQPLITKHPLDKTVNELSDVTLTVEAVGTALTYQWRKDGVALANGTTSDGTVISGATTSTLSLTTAHLSDVGSYTVVVSNNAATLISNVGLLRVSQAPVITVPVSPAALALDYLATTTLSVTATGAAPITYEWFLDGVLIPNVSTATIQIGPVTRAHEGTWTARASNSAGQSGSPAGAPTAVAIVTLNVPDTDGDGVFDDEEDTKGWDRTKADTDGDGYSDGVEKSLTTDPKLASSTPASKYYVAERDSAATMGSVLMKRIPANATLSTPDFWLGSTELTNKQFAAILQHGLHKLNNIEIVTVGSRRGIRYPRTTGSIICYLTDTAAILPTDDPATDITTTNADHSFIVPAALVNVPVRAVSWEAAYLAASVMNVFHGYISKNTAGFTFAPITTDGYRIPNDADWLAAARGGRPEASATYPTGTSLSSSQAWFNQTATSARPKNVGSYAANPFGCFDLAGNVAEWVFDPNGTESYIRGGGFSDPLTALRNDTHELVQRNILNKRIGIRLGLDAPASPVITTQPTAFSLVRSTQALELAAAATGAPPLALQWLKNGTAISGQNRSKFSIAVPKTTDAGSYSMRVTTNGINPQTTAVAKVSVVQVPSTRSFSIATGKDISLTVPYGAAPGETLRFAWFRNGTRLTNYFSIRTGTDTNVLVLKNCQPSDTDDFYNCEVRDNHDSPAVTVNFQLIVLGQPVVDAPVFTETTMVGETFSYQVVSSIASLSQSPTKFTSSTLPSGLTIDSATGVISGKPRVSGTFNVIVTGSNAFGSTSTQSVTLTVKSLADMQQSAAIGTFFGLINRNTALNDNLGGRIDFIVTSAATISGKITLGTAPYSFSGSLDTVYNPSTPVDPTATIVIKRSGKSSLGLALTIPVGTPQTFTGTLFELDSSGNATGTFSNFFGWRNQWHATALPAANFAGKHNIVLRIPTGSISDLSIPQGSGYASVTVSTAGLTTIAGKLPDGTGISFGSFVGPKGEQPLYQVLYAGKGSVIGAMTEAAGGFHLFSGTNSITWLKKPQSATSTEKLYKTDGIATALTPAGGLYAPPSTPNIIMGLPAPSPHNARLTFEYGGLVPSTGFVQDFAISSPAVVSFAGATIVNSTTCTINATTGSFSGSFKLTDSGVIRTVPYQGLVIPDPNNFGLGIGEGYFLLPGIPTATAPTLSGWVGLGAKP